jgi:aryl-alcohol dehydrogenase-like predicted oxidoreductase
METRALGRFEVSVVGLGCNNFGRRCDRVQTAAVVSAALDAGVTLFDTADVYGDGSSEEYLGAALGARRDEVVIATKFGMRMGDDPARAGGGARWVARAVEDSLRRLGTDRIDLYQFHRPDPETPIEETFEALDRLVRDGKVLEIGSSNFTGAQIDEAERVAAARDGARFVSVQNEYSLLQREPEADVLPACERLGLGFLPYFPLASGLLTGKYRPGETPAPDTRLGSVPAERAARFINDASFARATDLTSFADARGRSLLELAFGWLLSHPAVASVIAGATKPEQARANVRAATWKLDPADVAQVDGLVAR